MLGTDAVRVLEQVGVPREKVVLFGGPNNLPAMFAEMDVTMLMDLMPLLMENLGGDFGLTPEQMQQFMEAGMTGEIPTDLGDVDDLINRGQDIVGGRGGGGGAGGGGGGKRGGGGQ